MARATHLLFLAAALAGVLTTGAATAASAGGDAAPGPGTELRIASTIALDSAPTDMIAAAGSVWVSLGLEEIVRIEPSTNRVVARIRPGGVGLAAGLGAIWATNILSGDLLRIDPRTNRVTQRIRIGGLPAGIAVGHGSLWVANQLDSTVSRISPETGRTLAKVQLDPGGVWPGAILATAHAVWAVAGDGNVVDRIRPETSTVDLRLPIRGARAITLALGAVWVGVADSPTLVRIGNGKAVRVPVPGPRANGYGPLLAGGTSLWLAVPGKITRLRGGNPLEPSFRLPRDHVLSALAVAGDVWVADQTAARLLRLKTTGGVR